MYGHVVQFLADEEQNATVGCACADHPVAGYVADVNEVHFKFGVERVEVAAEALCGLEVALN